jgi:tetratricopeptide (TPR) repeat protein
MMRISKPVIAVILISLATVSYTVAQTGTYDLLLRASVLREAGMTHGALALLNEATEITADYRITLEKGEIYLLTGDFQMAEAEFLEASRIAGNSGSFGLARVYASTGDAALAIRFLEKNLQSPYRVSERRIMTDSHISKIENTGQWRLFLSGDHYSEEEVFLSEIEYLISIGRSDEAFEMVGEIPDISESVELIYAKALAAYSSGNFPVAINLLNSPSAAAIHEEKRNRLLAGSYLGMNDYRQASVFYTKLIDDEVPEPEFFLQRARAWYGMSDKKRSQADLEYFLKLFPGDNSALMLAAEVSAELGDSNSAMVYLNRNVEANPGSIEAYLSRGELLFSIRVWDRAVSDYSMALDLDPTDSEVWLKKAISLLNIGKTDDACHDFYRALRLGNRKAAEYISKNCIR